MYRCIHVHCVADSGPDVSEPDVRVDRYHASNRCHCVCQQFLCLRRHAVTISRTSGPRVCAVLAAVKRVDSECMCLVVGCESDEPHNRPQSSPDRTSVGDLHMYT
jgi:hypothetical protein